MAAKSQSNNQGSGGGGERRFTVDIVIVGGGPATLGLLCNAVKTNKLNELVAKGDGIAILEQGLSFGGGTLQDFGVNSNTSANGFIKCLYKRRQLNAPQGGQAHGGGGAATANQTQQQSSNNSPNPRRFLKAGEGAAALDPEHTKLKDMTNQGLDEGDSDDDAAEDEDVYQPKKFDYIALNPFKDLYKQSPLVQMTFEFGPSIIPLSTVGMVLNYTGNHLLHFIHTMLGRRIFYPAHRVISVQLMQNGDIVTTAMRNEVSIILNNDTSSSAASSSLEDGETSTNQPFKMISHGEVQVSFRSKAIVLSNGGTQGLHPDFYSWFPSLREKQQDVITSDYLLKKAGYLATIKRMKSQQKRKVVIIGGSHSGFSSAWILLNGPADILHNTAVTPTVQYTKKNTGKFEFPGAAQRTIENCTRCCACHHTSKKQRKGPCKCICKCYGFFKYSDFGVDYSSDLIDFGTNDITILYRDRIRVFYSRVQNAKTEGYTDFKQLNFSNKNGFLYSFTGLRGDSKKMYKAIQRGDEKRVRLVKAPTPAEQAQYVEGADLVIWACGYQTNRIPVKDIDNRIVQMSAKVPFTQFDIDSRNRIITSDNGLLMKTFGSGLAFPCRTNDGMIMPEAGKFNPRADSFSLYQNYVANCLLGSLLPKSRLMNKNHRTIRLGNKKLTTVQALTNQATTNTAVPIKLGSGGSWQRTGSEQAPPTRSNTITRPILKPTTAIKEAPAATTKLASQTINIKNVKASPTKIATGGKAAILEKSQPAQTNSTVAATRVIPQFVSSNKESQAVSTTILVATSNQDSIEFQGPTPGYLQTNYITEQRKKENTTASPAPKKKQWVPSSQYHGPPLNKIPKDTMKAIELRVKNTDQKQAMNEAANSGLVQTSSFDCQQSPENMIVKAPTYIQMHLSESGKAFQAVSQSFSMLQQQQQQQQLQQTNNISVANRFTIRPKEFQGQFPGDALPQTGYHGESTHHQAYGGFVEKQPIIGVLEKHIFSTPQKTMSSKITNGGLASSPLVYNQTSTVIDNTPQVHKRKASFKIVKQGSGGHAGAKTNDFGTFASTVLADKRYQPSKAPAVMYAEKIVESTSTGNLHNLLSSTTKQQQNIQVVNQGKPSDGGGSPGKPVSQSALKRNSSSSHQQTGGVVKKKHQSKHNLPEKRGTSNMIGQTGNSSNSTNNTTVMSTNQKSTANLTKVKRSPAKIHKNKHLPQRVKTSEQVLSNLASAGQRQIFSDESGSVSSAKRMSSQLVTGSPQQQLHSVQTSNVITLAQLNLASSANNSQTPKNAKIITGTEQHKIQSSYSVKRRQTAPDEETTEQRNAPMNDNFVASEDTSLPPGAKRPSYTGFTNVQHRESVGGTESKKTNSSMPMSRQGTDLGMTSATLIDGSDHHMSPSKTSTTKMQTIYKNEIHQHHHQHQLQHKTAYPEAQSPMLSQTGGTISKAGGSSVSRRKSVSLTHRSRSKGKHVGMETTAEVPTSGFFPADTRNGGAAPGDSSYGLVQKKQQLQGNNIFNAPQQTMSNTKQIAGSIFGRPSNAQTVFVDQNYQQRKSVSVYDAQGRLVNNLNQSTPVVPVKIFQLPAQKQIQQIPATFLSQTTNSNQISLGSPGIPANGHKKNNMSQYPNNYINTQQKQTSSGGAAIITAPKQQPLQQQQQPAVQQHQQPQQVQMTQQQLMVAQQQMNRNPQCGSPKKSNITLEKQLSQPLQQTHIAQYGLMQVNHNYQKGGIQGVQGGRPAAPQTNPIIVPQTSVQQYKGRQQNSMMGQPFSTSGNNTIVHKPVAQMFSSPVKTTQALQAAAAATHSPLKLKQHQKVQLISYSQSQQMVPGPIHHTTMTMSSKSPQLTVVQQPRKMDISSPLVFQTKQHPAASSELQQHQLSRK